MIVCVLGVISVDSFLLGLLMFLWNGVSSPAPSSPEEDRRGQNLRAWVER